MHKIQASYIKAKNEHETVKQIENESKLKILSENIFLVSNEWEDESGKRILDPREDFLMNEEDSIKYFKLTHEEYKNKGLDVPDYNTTPDYKTFSALLKAEKDLIEWGMSLVNKNNPEVEIKKLGEVASWNIEVRKNLIDLTLKLAI